MFTPRPCYAYNVKNSEFHQAESISQLAYNLLGRKDNNTMRRIYDSVSSAVDNKSQSYGYVFFYASEGIHPPHTINLKIRNKMKNYFKKGDEIDTSKGVIAYLEDGTEYYYASLQEAAENHYTTYQNISRALREPGKGKTGHPLAKDSWTAAGYMWRYAQ